MTKEEAKNLLLQLADFNIAIAMAGEKLPLSDLKENKWYTSTKFDFENGDTYFAIDTDGSIDELEYDEFPSIDVGCVNLGNACKDKEYLERRLPEITLYNRLSNFAEVVNEGWKPDWEDERELKWYVNYANIGKIWYIDHRDRNNTINVTYFKTEELAQRAIDEIVIPWEKEFKLCTYTFVR